MGLAFIVSDGPAIGDCGASTEVPGRTCICVTAEYSRVAKRQLITGHAALGGGNGELQLGIFGSHALHTYPSTFEEVIPALTDCTKTNTDQVANDGGEDSGTWWQAACIGMFCVRCILIGMLMWTKWHDNLSFKSIRSDCIQYVPLQLSILYSSIEYLYVDS